ncbi:MAG: hypothetical protein C4519_20150 [Desulfobacteraceae bacterium]|nr:MAG: hypothetical protein C4519_20150 [Desulfobacteraceae bacterium]
MISTKKETASRRYRFRANQSGSALVITLLVLMAVTILGVACIHSSIIELKISSNERQMRENFYLTESAAMEGVQRLKDLLEDDLNEQFVFWHHPRRDSGKARINFRDPAQWDGDGKGDDNCMRSGMDPDTFLAAVEWKVATGSSLILTESRLYQNRVYGLGTRQGDLNLIEIGVNLRY